MIVNKITIRRGATIKTQDYESARVDVEMEAVLEDGDTLSAAYQQLREQVHERLRNEIDQVELGAWRAKSKAHRFGV